MKIYMKQLRLIILFSILSLSVTVRAMEEQSVSLDTPTGKINGKIGLPDAKKPPIVLLIAGSGPTDMDGNTNSGGFSMKNNSLKLLAEGRSEVLRLSVSIKGELLRVLRLLKKRETLGSKIM